MEAWSIQLNKTRYLQSSGCINTTVWMHHKDAEKTYREKASWELYKKSRAILNKSWKQHPTKQHLHDHFLLFLKPSKSDEQDMQNIAW